jgi:amidophosphoribosyltransferase
LIWQGTVYKHESLQAHEKAPCLFEFVYLARPDSVLDGASVYQCRINMGTKLAEKIKREWSHLPIDVVIPIPSTSRVAAQEIATRLNIPYRDALVRNRYVGRTFIMPGQAQRKQSIRRKLNPIPQAFQGKNVLLVDDSIVRGTTIREIIAMVREQGAKHVYVCSAAPPVRFPNVYGIDMPARSELIASGRDVPQLAKNIGADELIFQDLEDLKQAITDAAPVSRILIRPSSMECMSQETSPKNISTRWNKNGTTLPNILKMSQATSQEISQPTSSRMTVRVLPGPSA